MLTNRQDILIKLFEVLSSNHVDLETRTCDKLFSDLTFKHEASSDALFVKLEVLDLDFKARPHIYLILRTNYPS